MPRIEHKREFYTADMTRLIGFRDGSEIFWRLTETAILYKVFYGKAQTAKEFYSIKRISREKQLAAFADAVERTSAAIESSIAFKAERIASRKAASVAKRLEVGSILCGSWGYEQTNVEFYEVLELSASGKTCTIQRIKCDEKPTGFMSGRCLPLPGEYVGQPLKNKRISFDSVSIECCTLTLWDGREQYASHYA
jgi:hypothetical protein